MKYKAKRPTREQLSGMSPSQLKTFIKRRGHSVARDFFKTESVSHYRGRAYRFRWWAGEFVVDVSCRLTEFDRWANSLDRVVSFKNWIETSAIESKLRSKMRFAYDLLIKAKEESDVVPGNVYPAKGGRKSPGTEWWLVVAVSDTGAHCIGFNDAGYPVSTASYVKSAMRERPVIGRVDMDSITLIPKVEK